MLYLPWHHDVLWSALQSRHWLTLLPGIVEPAFKNPATEVASASATSIACGGPVSEGQHDSYELFAQSWFYLYVRPSPGVCALSNTSFWLEIMFCSFNPVHIQTWNIVACSAAILFRAPTQTPRAHHITSPGSHHQTSNCPDQRLIC